MTQTTALLVLAAAGAVFLAGGLYANHRFQKWMADYDREHSND